MTNTELTWLTDVWTVLHKEVRELTMALAASRVTLGIFALTSLLMGALLVGCAATGWRNGLLLLIIWLLAPILPTVVAVAESFAGEREHGTFESLLMTPLSPVALLAGKITAAALFGWMATVFALMLAVGAINLLGMHVAISLTNIGVMLTLSLLSAILAASAGSYLIAHVATVRQAYLRLSWLGAMFVIAMAILLLFLNGRPLQFSHMLAADRGSGLAPLLILGVILLGIDALLYAAAALHFRRNELLAD